LMAMDARSLPEALTIVMKRRGWSQARLGRELGMGQVWVSKVTRGKIDPGMGKAIKLLGRLDLEVHITPKREEKGPVERREFLMAATSAALVPSGGADPYRDREYLEALAGSLARNRYSIGGTPLVPSALAHVTRTRAALDGSTDRASLATAAELMSQITLVLYDAEKLSHAGRVAALALDFALRARNANAQARAYDNLSRLSLYTGDHSRGILYARRGLGIPEISPSQRASLNMRLGRCLARTPGGAAAARVALDRALGSDGLSPSARAALAGDVGIGMSHLREYAEAQSLLGTAIAQTGGWSPLFQVQYLGRQIQTALRARDLEFASERMHRLSRALPFVTSGRVNRRVAQILDATAGLDGSELRGARERLQAVAGTEKRHA